ncbi:nitrogenase component 1 [Blautia sp. NSJ-166]|uniref:nitrogenase component 1 n=1 Tax=Blautia sp. NSJ-166 TaxID=2931882 RepID=UPI001FD3878A|nr:nitrogenase component 1 [Blautia sp. NSJ-166]MCJ8044716.1 nitrogenase component 1 [Blautia sp. NSJ-166]
MRGLRKYLTPFAPDQSGAVSVLYELGGIIVICDAGGCTGNVCGFDEPRWFERKSAVFSAGLRDMDAILGRDDRLVAKLVDAAEKVEAGFAAVIGTPVPAVIGTDYQALKRMCEKKTDLPVLAVNTDGMELYDGGERKAYLELFKVFAREKLPVETGRVGILGMTPQDVSDLKAADKLREKFKSQGHQAVCYGMGDGLDEVKKASSVEKNIVVSPAALECARYLEKTFGTPYEVGYPLVEELVPDMEYAGKKILIVQQQVMAGSIREELQKRGADGEITVASWFFMEKDLREEGDVPLKDEEDYMDLVEKGRYDVIFADPCMKRMAKTFSGVFVDAVHFAVSGKCR